MTSELEHQIARLSVFLNIKSYIQGYALCQQMKVNTYPLAPPLALIKANPHAYPFSTVTIDFITDLPESNGYNTLYIAVNYDLTKAIVLILCIKTIDAIDIAKLYHDNVYWRFGLLNRIISDRGPQFSSQVFQEMNKQLGVTLFISTAFYPQTDRQTKKTNQEIKAYL